MDITTVKLDRDSNKVEISFRQPNGQATEETTFKCKDQPMKSFADAMEKLDVDFSEIMQQPGDNDVRVIGVHFGEKGGRETFQMLGGIQVDAGFSSLNTPQLYAPADGQASPATLSDEQHKRLKKLRIEAKKYYDGNRVGFQDNLPLEGEQQPEEVGATT